MSDRDIERIDLLMLTGSGYYAKGPSAQLALKLIYCSKMI